LLFKRIQNQRGKVRLVLAGAAAVYASIWYYLELAALLREVFRCCGMRRLEIEARVAWIAVFYFVLVPALAVAVSFLMALIVLPGTSLGGFHDTWNVVPLSVRRLMLVPVLHVALLVWRWPSVLLADRGDGPVECRADNGSATSANGSRT
jgi:hypothetical protein